MSQQVPFRLSLTGDLSDQHQFEGYDGYTSLAGFAWTLALAANFADTGEIRLKGDFPGRHAVRASAVTPGSIIADFGVILNNNPAEIFLLGAAPATVLAAEFFYDLLTRVIARNIGQNYEPKTGLLKNLIKVRGGDIEALVAKSEPSIKQSHSVIGNGADKIQIIGGHNIIRTYTHKTRDYVNQNIQEPGIFSKDFSVAAFNVNSGHGAFYDFDLHRIIPFSTPKKVLIGIRSVLSWGLDQYANSTNRLVHATYYKIVSLDGRIKNYVITDAKKVAD